MPKAHQHNFLQGTQGGVPTVLGRGQRQRQDALPGLSVHGHDANHNVRKQTQLKQSPAQYARELEYEAHTTLDEFSYVKKKDDMKYYKNLVKIVGKEHCLILSAEDSKYLDFFVAKCKSVIEALRAKKNTRKSLIKKKQ